MRAGLLNEFAYFSPCVEVRSPSGALKRTYEEGFRLRCHRRKLSAVYGDGLNASEEFIENRVVLQVRYDSRIDERGRITYGGKAYRIVLLDKQRDNTYLITCAKDNE